MQLSLYDLFFVTLFLLLLLLLLLFPTCPGRREPKMQGFSRTPRAASARGGCEVFSGLVDGCEYLVADLDRDGFYIFLKACLLGHDHHCCAHTFNMMRRRRVRA